MKVVIFGASSLASQLWYLLSHNGSHEVVGFTVDAAFRQADSFHNLPLVDFEIVETVFSPAEHGMFVPVGYADMNGLREARSRTARDKGYRLPSYIASRAMTWPDLDVGDGCLVLDGAIVQPFSSLGEGTSVRSGAVVSHHGTIGDYTYVAPGAVLGGNARIGNRCVIGLNATIISGVTVRDRCFVAAGAVVTKDTEPGRMYLGAPARKRPLPTEALRSGATKRRCM
ncbi:MAG: acetyltransferase [Hyphomicrobiales bacterium]|nr:acetyltransferase [Hyphomicrobiales bacterium]